MGVLGIVLIVVILIASIALHEAGHLLTAKHYGMRVTQYFVGFGPKIFSFRRGETEYGLKAVLAGGYCKIVGMSPLEAADGNRPGDVRAVSAAVAALPTHTQPDERRLFYTYPARQRTVVLAAGSITHFVLAIVLTVVALAVAGDLTGNGSPTLAVDTVTACAQPADNGSCPAGAPQSPALAAGFRAGDRVVAVDGVRLNRWQDFVDRVQPAAGTPLRVTVARGGTEQTLTVTPASVVRKDANGRLQPAVGVIGIAPQLRSVHYSLFGAVAHTPAVIGQYVVGTVKGLGRIPAAVPHLIEGKPRTVNDPAGVVDIARIGGDIGRSDQSLGTKAGALLVTGASINFFVGVFNLLPLLPLDGGHIAIVGFENVRAWFARRLGRRDPGRVDLLKVLPVAYVVIAAFVGLSLLLVYAGLFNPIQGT